MNRALAVICCYFIFCASGLSVKEILVKIKGRANATDEKNRLKNSKINESHLYEGERASKKNDQRSYVVLNHNFKSHFFDGNPHQLVNTGFYDLNLLGFKLNMKESDSVHRNKPKLRSTKKYIQSTTQRVRPLKEKNTQKLPLVRLVPITNMGKPIIDTELSQRPHYTPFLTYHYHPSALRLPHRQPSILKDAAKYHVRVPILWNYSKNHNTQALPHSGTERDIIGNQTHAAFYLDEPLMGTYVTNELKKQNVQKSSYKRVTCKSPICKLILNKHKQRVDNGVQNNSRCICDAVTAKDQDHTSKEDIVHMEALSQILKDLNDIVEKI